MESVFQHPMGFGIISLLFSMSCLNFWVNGPADQTPRNKKAILLFIGLSAACFCGE